MSGAVRFYQEAPENKEYHELLDALAERKFFGELILYFQGGNIESSRIGERNTKREIQEQMRSRKRRKAVVRPKGAPREDRCKT